MTEQEKREKVIKGLECLAKQHGIVGVCEPENCPYGDLHTCANEIARDALALLKALSEFKAYFDDLYGKGLEVANWHMNGATEPFDSFYDSAIEEMQHD